MAASGAAVRIRRLRQRFGINAPRLAIRAHVAWYWRALLAVAVISLSLASAAWIYDAGRKMAGYPAGEPTQELQSLRNYVMELDAELTKLRGLVGSGESNLQMERATMRQLLSQIKVLENENVSLREDLAFFEGILPGAGLGAGEGVRIDRLRIEPDGGDGDYRYRLLVVAGGDRRGGGFKGSLRLQAVVMQNGNKVTVDLSSKESEQGSRLLEVKHVHRVEGVFSVPAGARLLSVEASLLQEGQVRARQSATL